MLLWYNPYRYKQPILYCANVVFFSYLFMTPVPFLSISIILPTFYEVCHCLKHVHKPFHFINVIILGLSMYGLRGGERQRDLFVCSRFYGTRATGAVMCQKGKGSPAYCATGTILEPGHLLLRHF